MSLLGEHFLDRCGLWHEAPYFDALHQVTALFPFAVLQRLAGLHDMVTRALRRTSEDLAVREVEQPAERLRDQFALLLLAIDACEQRDFHKHTRDEERSLEELRVDVHVERQLPLLLRFLLLGTKLLVPLRVCALRQELLDALRVEDILQRGLRLADEAHPERTQPNLNDGAVVQDLGCDVRLVDGLLEVRHEQHVPGAVEVVMKSVMVDVHQHCSCFEDSTIRLVEMHG